MFLTLWPDVISPHSACSALVLLVVILGECFVTQAATLPTGFSESQVASGLAAPTAMAFAPDGRLFVCEQTGRLRVIKNGSLLITPFVQLTVDSAGERGLLGVAFDPNFATNQFVYVYYTATTPSVHNRVSRFTANGDTAVAGSEVVILDLNNLSSATNHNGGALHFGPDGKLYIAVGENANSSNSQSLANLLGKVLRINADGSIPTDNPFFNTASGINRIIWALGLRNPYTFAFQPGTGLMFVNDVGASSFEEINRGQAGANYGWPTCEGSCSNPNFVSPLFSYGHGTGPTTGCAIVGGAFYNPPTSQFPSNYTGSFFFADLCSGWIRRLDTAQGNAALDFATGLSQPVDLKVASDGSLYYLQRGGGQVFRVRYVSQSQFNFTQTTFPGAEGSGAVAITVSRTGDLSTPASVDYATTNGTAVDSSDYTTNLGRLTFAPGEASRVFVILLTDDLYPENNETASLSLSNGIGATLGAQTTSQLIISDNDIVSPTTNPADLSTFFVRQHYLDFLNREADSGGLGYWSQQMELCGSDTQCIHSRRIGVSAAFFIENEFQETGFFIVRMYRAGLARRPSFTDFVRDRTRLAVGANLETEKLAYALDYVQRAEFVGRFPLTQGSAEFVDALIAAVRTASGLDLVNKRADLLGEYSLGSNQSDSRARVLRKLIEYDEYRQVEFNGAFVLAQYFGYLRRDPDEGGYQFWIDILNNRVPNNYRSMVCAFITSAEYQRRFSSVVTRSNQDCGP